MLLVLLLSGCAVVNPTYLPSGEKGYSINCSGTALSWNACYEKAGELCGVKGYEIAAGGSEQGSVVAANQSGLFGGSTMHRSMLIKCRG